MKIVIISAMVEEVKKIKEIYHSQLITTINNQEVESFKTIKNEYYLLNAGIGKVNAAITTTLLIEKLNPDLIISIGTSGGVSENLVIGDLILADKLCFHDVDVTGFGYKSFQLPDEEQYFKINNLVWLEDRLKKINIQYHIGTIATGDIFINDKKKKIDLTKQIDNLYAVEMESCAIVMTSKHLNIPCYVLRTVSDLAYSNSTIEFDEYLELVSSKFIKLIEALEYE